MKRERLIATLSFIVVAVVARFLPHPTNMTPVLAMSLLAGALLPIRWALSASVIAMLTGDVLLGWSVSNLGGYPALAAAVWLGSWSWKRKSVDLMIASVLGSATIFYVLSNLMVWLTSGMYAISLSGLIACYVAGIPFYGRDIAGTLAYTIFLFGTLVVLSLRYRQLVLIKGE